MLEGYWGKERKKKALILLALLSLCVTMIIFIVFKFMYSVIESKSFTAMVNNTTEMMSAMRDVTVDNVVFHLADVKAHLAECAAQHQMDLLDTEKNISVILKDIPLPEYGVDYIFHRANGAAGSGLGTAAVFSAEKLAAVWQGETVVDGPRYREDGAYTMIFSAPVYQKGTVQGVLSVVLDGFCLSEWISDVQFPSGGGLAYIIDENGTNIAVSTVINRDWVMSEYNAQSLAETDEQSRTVADLERMPLKGFTGEGSYLWEGNRNYLVYAPVPDTGWGLFVGFYGEALHRYAQEITDGGFTQNQIYLGILVLLLCVLSIAEIRWLGREQRDNNVLTAQQEALLKLQQKTEAQSALLKAHHQTILSSLEYAKRIQHNLLPDKQDCKRRFSEFGLIWSPKDAVGGDLYWLKHYPAGSLLCVCDCTGHGVPGAMLTMLTAATLDAIVKEENCRDPAEIMWQLDCKLYSVLNAHFEKNGQDDLAAGIHDGADLALLFIDRDNGVTLASGNMRLFVCNGEEVMEIKGQRIHIGEGRLKTKEQIRTVTIPSDPRNRYYIATDGYFDQIGGESGRPFGYQPFKQMLLQHHGETMEQMMEVLWEAFEQHRGEEIRRDDVELVGIRA